MLAPEQRFGQHLVIPEGLYDQRQGTTNTYQVLVVNEGEQPLLLDIGRTMTGELVKPDLWPSPEPPAPALQAMAEPPEPPDMQQLWEDLEMPDNMFLKKDPLLKKEVWKPGTQPIRQKFRNLNPRQEAELEAQLETWLAEGVIKPSSSAWSSPLVPIKKKDGSIGWASHTKQHVSRGACVARASLHRSSLHGAQAYQQSPSDGRGPYRC